LVDAPLTYGGLAGVILSAGFVYWEVGRFAAPQTPESRFDERKEILGYTAGLFIGIPVAVPFLFFLEALANVALLVAALDLGLVVIGTELAQWLFLRSRYFGRVPASTFYALGMRSGVSAILILTIVAQFASRPTIDALGIAVVGAQCLALVFASATGALLSIPRTLLAGGAGGPVRGAMFGAVAVALIGSPFLLGAAAGLTGALIAAAGSGVLYLRRLRPLLSRVGAAEARRPESSPLPSGFGRQPPKK
jgi:hypothetical protein